MNPEIQVMQAFKGEYWPTLHTVWTKSGLDFACVQSVINGLRNRGLVVRQGNRYMLKLLAQCLKGMGIE